jgi:hypothetical protein
VAGPDGAAYKARQVVFQTVMMGQGGKAAGTQGVRVASVGEDSVLHSNVVIRERCSVGKRVILASGVAIGTDGFGYRPSPDGRGIAKIPHIGSVVIEDERGKLDLRLAPPQNVQALLRALGGRAGIDAFDSVNLAQTITRALQAGQPGDDRRSRVHAMSALADVPGMPAGLAEVLDRHATIFGFGAQVNPMRASREVLGAIEGLDARTAAEIVAAREAGRPRPAAGRAEPWLTNLEGPVYTIRSTGRVAGGIASTVTAVVANEGIGLGARVGRIAILELR